MFFSRYREARLKDKILKHLLPISNAHKPADNTLHLAEVLKTEEFLIVYVSEDIIDKGFVKATSITGMGIGTYGCKVLSINATGTYFYKNGGFRKEARIEILRQVWQFVKIVAAVINAVAIIYIAYKSYELQVSSNSHPQKQIPVVAKHR